jgi:hypothetical protein
MTIVAWNFFSLVTFNNTFLSLKFSAKMTSAYTIFSQIKKGPKGSKCGHIEEGEKYNHGGEEGVGFIVVNLFAL